jgi:hypothetical protein
VYTSVVYSTFDVEMTSGSAGPSWVGVEYYDCLFLTYEVIATSVMDGETFSVRLKSSMSPATRTHVYGSYVPFSSERGSGYRFSALIYLENQVLFSPADEVPFFDMIMRACRGYDETREGVVKRTTMTRSAILQKFSQCKAELGAFLRCEQDWCEHRDGEVPSLINVFGERFEANPGRENDAVQGMVALGAADDEWKFGIALWSFSERHSGVQYR